MKYKLLFFFALSNEKIFRFSAILTSNEKWQMNDIESVEFSINRIWKW